ncbi:hypothetical protein MNBD_GAMMA04-28 [hydrothermal vent metagenome]|uniref:6-hydroxymethylpterin diphosphokinase MptE-like domain-containing protein n=1 Tax=hydrothermal vent metagenome TaxID=652676 RepID=A0A3B0X255_9ZZZZ
MTLTQTLQNETVLDGFYSEQLQESSSSHIYQTFVGKELPDNKLFVVLGTDSGLLVDYLASIATAGQRFVCVDFPEVIEFISKTRATLLQEASHFKLELYTFEQFCYESLYDSDQDYVIRNAVILLRSLVMVEGKSIYKGLDVAHKEQFHRFRIDRIDNRDFKKTFNQQLENSCDLQHPLSVIKGELKGEVPAILLGGGPSLDQVISWLKHNQNKIWIFAASRICKRLIKEGITPDFIGVFDGHPLMFDYSKEMYAFQKDSILVTGEHPYPPLIRQWSGLKTYSRRRFPWARGGEENFISDGPTVTNALFGIACYLGVPQLYLAGVDFCFTSEGVCHESGSIETKNQQNDASDTKAINYRGEEVSTNIQLYDARNLLEAHLIKLKKNWPQFKVSNLNDGAAMVQGIHYQNLEQIKLGGGKFNVVEQFKTALQWNAKTEKAFQTFLKGEVNHHSKWLDNIVKESKKGLHLSRTLFSDTSKQSAKIKAVLKQKTKLEKLVGADYQTLVNYGYQAFMETLKPVESETDMSQQEMQNALMGFFGGLNVAADGFLLKLTSLKQEIAFRLLEIEPTTDFVLLTEHWMAHQIPGRFYVWLEHIAQQLERDYKARFPEQVAQLEAAFQHMKTDETALKASFSQRFDPPKAFILRLQVAFESKKRQAVQDILRQLSLIQSNEHAMVASLAIGMSLELKGEFEYALIHYLTVDPNHKVLFIQHQLYPLAFSLKQFEKGLQALNALSLMDTRYLPTYAESLVVLGEFKSAIVAYQAYPLLFEDTEVLIQLIRLQVQQQDIEAANTLLQKAVESPLIDQDRLQSFVNTLNSEDEKD